MESCVATNSCFRASVTDLRGDSQFDGCFFDDIGGFGTQLGCGKRMTSMEGLLINECAGDQ